MSAGRKKIMDALEGISDDDDGSSSGGESSGGGGDGDAGSGGGGEGGGGKKLKGADGRPAAAAAAAPKKKVVTLDDLEAQGFTAGPSVLYMKAPEEAQQDWSWGNGRTQKDAEPEEEGAEERARTREAATTGAEVGADLAMRTAAHAAKLRDAARDERQRLAAEKKLTFNQKEKRKRAEGKATKGTNFVEEEKRLQRNFGMYSGFD